MRLALVVLTVAAGVALAKPVTYKLPPETSALKKTDEPGYQKADSLCAACHSRDYITTQARGKGRDFWTAEVKKMVDVYAAPIAEVDRGPIVDYLTANY
jgi:hypothetical protein